MERKAEAEPKAEGKSCEIEEKRKSEPCDWLNKEIEEQIRTLPRLFSTEIWGGGFICSNWDEEDVADYGSDYPDDYDDTLLREMIDRHDRHVELFPPKERKCMDVIDFCDNLILGYLRSHQGLDYKFVGFASYLIPTFSRKYGDVLHLNFFARLNEPSNSLPTLIFAEVANGDPQKVIRCVPLDDPPYKNGDEDKPTTPIVHHPGGEECVYCEHAKGGSLGENSYFLAPML